MTSFIRKRVKRAAADAERGWPEYMFGGHLRTSTLVLVIAFLAVWWVYDDHQQSVKSNTKTTQVPATQIVPPGFVPDPNYTWVPRTRVQEPLPSVTETPTTRPPPPTTTTAPPPFQLPTIVLPPPFGPPVSPTPPAPPGQAPTPPPAPAAPTLPPLQLPSLP